MKCSICLSESSRHFLLVVKNGYQIKRCINCGFIFVSSPPAQTDLRHFYKSFDYKNSSFAEIRIRQDARRSLNVIERFQSWHHTLFDIGCGRGYFMDEARRKKWDVYGIDFSSSVIDYANKTLLLKAKKRDILSYKVYTKYDVVTLIQVIEHFSRPDVVIKKCSQLIKRGGLLYLATPNIDSISAKIDLKNFDYLIPPEHLCFFNQKILSKLLEQNSFDVIYAGSWSYPEDLAGIIKKVIFHNQNFQTSRQNSKYEYGSGKLNIYKRLKSILFDEIFCRVFYRILNLDLLGINLEIIAIKR